MSENSSEPMPMTPPPLKRGRTVEPVTTGGEDGQPSGNGGGGVADGSAVDGGTGVLTGVDIPAGVGVTSCLVKQPDCGRVMRTISKTKKRDWLR